MDFVRTFVGYFIQILLHLDFHWINHHFLRATFEFLTLSLFYR